MPEYRIFYNYMNGDLGGRDLTNADDWDGMKVVDITTDIAVGETEQSVEEDMREIKQYILQNGNHTAIDIADFKIKIYEEDSAFFKGEANDE
jgi:hypothetical protein